MSKKRIPTEDFQPHENLTELSDYRWNDRMVNHLFCKTCGVYPYHGGGDYGYRVNLGCVEQINPFSIPITMNDGKSMPLAG